MLMMV